MKKIKVGDKVKLKSYTTYRSSRVNPKIGSKHECMGRVMSIGKESKMIIIRWSNGAVNSYTIDNLMVFKKRKINIKPNINSIW
jgi:hypothetical protein